MNGVDTKEEDKARIRRMTLSWVNEWVSDQSSEKRKEKLIYFQESTQRQPKMEDESKIERKE